MKRNDQEHKDQCALFEWRDLHLNKIEHIDALHAFPAGGERNPVVAAKLKKEGAPKGMLDIVWPRPRGSYFGFYFELKVQYRNLTTNRMYSNKPTDEQSAWIAYFLSQGYYAGWCYGWENLRDEIIKYNNLGPSHFLSNISKPTPPDIIEPSHIIETSNRAYKILHALSLEEHPINTTLLSIESKLPVGAIHAPLQKLIDNGFVDRVASPPSKRNLYVINGAGHQHYKQLVRSLS